MRWRVRQVGAARAGRWPGRLADERGAVSLSLPVFCAIVVMVGVLLARVGAGADLRAGTQTAADAAALAAAHETGTLIIELAVEILAEAEENPDADLPPLDPEVLCGLIDDGAVSAAAEDYAASNDSTVTAYERGCLEVAVEVASNDAVPDVFGMTGEDGPSTAGATAVVEVPPLAGLEEGADVELDVWLVE